MPIGGAPRLDREKLAARAPEQAKIFHGETWLDCARHTGRARFCGAIRRVVPVGGAVFPLVSR